jgi:hypothetical protein
VAFTQRVDGCEGVHRDQHSHNDIVGFYLGAICLFYGITLGLLAVGTWEAYSDLDAKVGEEASALAALYRDVSSFPDPKRSELQADLREYARQVIDVAWPLQRRGIVPQNAAGTLEVLQSHLASFEPMTEGQKTRYAETYREFDRIVELRRIRLKSVVAGLPMPLWSVVLVGAFVQYRGDLVLRHEEPDHALLDDDNVLWPSRSADFPASGDGQSIPGRDQCQPRSVRACVSAIDAACEVIENIIPYRESNTVETESRW